MTCKDCVHYGVCMETRENVQMLAYLTNNNVEKVCKRAKDKNKIIELPPKDDLYFIFSRKALKVKTIHTTVERNKNGKLCVFVSLIFVGYGATFITINYTEQLGKTIFLTKEEAEKALQKGCEG